MKTSIYTWDELSEGSQEAAINQYREDDLEYPYDYDIEYHKERLNARGFEDAEISFSGFYSQGDGASFTADVNLEKIFSVMVYQSTCWDDIKIFYHFLELIKRNMIEFTIWSKRTGHHYSHENTCTIDHEIDLYMKNYSSQAEDWFWNAAEGLTEKIEDLRHEWSQDIYYSLRAKYEYQQSDEYIIKLLQDNEFTKKGAIYYE